MDRRVGAQAALLALGVFAVYAAGTCRTIYVGDSGELVAAAATLGIPHPSGYPLYVLLGKLWTLAVPVGSIAWRMSLFSAAAAAAACGLLYTLLRRLGVAALAAVFAALLLAFSPSFWSQANIQRVYSLNALALTAVTAAAFEWTRRKRLGWLVLAEGLAGLGASNHTAMIPAALAVGVFAWVGEPALFRRPRHLVAVIGAGLLGLAPYLYLPLRSRWNPRLDWGNPETLEGFLDVVLRRGFWQRAWIESAADGLPIAGDYLRGLGEELLWVGAALAVAGAVVGWRRGDRRLPVLLALLVMATNLVSVGLHGSRSDIFLWHRYYIPSYVMAALLAAFGLEGVLRRWGSKVAAPALLIPLVLLLTGAPRFDRGDYRVAEELGRTLLGTLPPGAHLAASDDNILFVLIYLQLVEGLRPDVDLILQGVGQADLGVLRFDPDREPLYFTHHPNWNAAGLEVVPVGLTFRVLRAGRPWPEPVIPMTELPGAGEPAYRDVLTQNLVGHFHYMLGVTFERRDWPRAQAEFVKAAAAAPKNDVLFYNLGLIYRRNGLAERALAAFERAWEINPRHIASNRPVRPGDRVVEMAREVERLEALERRLAAAGLPARFAPGEAEYHRRMAELLAAAGEERAARGQRLRALEADARTDAPPTAPPPAP